MMNSSASSAMKEPADSSEAIKGWPGRAEVAAGAVSCLGAIDSRSQGSNPGQGSEHRQVEIMESDPQY